MNINIEELHKANADVSHATKQEIKEIHKAQKHTVKNFAQAAQEYVLDHEGIDTNDSEHWTNTVFATDHTATGQVHILQINVDDNSKIREWFIAKKKLLRTEK